MGLLTVHSIQSEGLDTDKDLVLVDDWIWDSIFDEKGVGVPFAILDANCLHLGK